jgi:hypothetical protein
MALIFIMGYCGLLQSPMAKVFQSISAKKPRYVSPENGRYEAAALFSGESISRFI